MTSSGRITANTYDLVGNVTQVASTCPWLPNQSFIENFNYDSADQLTAAQENQNNGYQLTVNYGHWGKVNNYDLAQTDFINNTSTGDSRLFTYPSDPNNLQVAQTIFAPEQCNGTADILFSFGINGSLRKRETTQPQQHTEYYLFNSQGNLKAYSDDIMGFAYYGYNAANTRTYKLSLYNTNVWINGQQEPLNMQLQQAMFYPNTYLNFNGNGEYTKHYYNGTERIASRLGDNTTTIALNNNILEDRKLLLEDQFRVDIHKLIEETVPIDLPPFMDVNTLQPIGTPNDIYYYHPNHLGSTSFVTDQNQTITQGFLYAPFGEITTEYNINFGNNVIPKYSFNAKELDEETGMYYYEARYYAPPTFTSRDPLFEKYFWMSPYAYCTNNPVKYVDPDGRKFVVPRVKIKGQKGRYNVTFNGTSITMQRTGIRKSEETIQYQSGTNEFVDNMVASYNYIVNCEGADVDNAMKQVAQSTTSINVKNKRDDGSYGHKTIRFDFSQGSKIEREDGVSGYQSPALGFWSEAYHAYLDIIDKKTQKSLSSFSDPYHLKEENYVHVTKENVVIDALNRYYGSNETKRNHYFDNKYGVTMKNVTDTNMEIK